MNHEEAKEAVAIYDQIHSDNEQIKRIALVRKDANRLEFVFKGKFGGYAYGAEMLSRSYQYTAGDLDQVANNILDTVETFHRNRIANNCRRLAQLGCAAPE